MKDIIIFQKIECCSLGFFSYFHVNSFGLYFSSQNTLLEHGMWEPTMSTPLTGGVHSDHTGWVLVHYIFTALFFCNESAVGERHYKTMQVSYSSSNCPLDFAVIEDSYPLSTYFDVCKRKALQLQPFPMLAGWQEAFFHKQKPCLLPKCLLVYILSV